MLNGCPDPGSGLASLLIGINTLLILEDNGTLLRYEMIEIVDQSLSNLKSSRLGSGLSDETARFAHAQNLPSFCPETPRCCAAKRSRRLSIPIAGARPRRQSSLRKSTIPPATAALCVIPKAACWPSSKKTA